MQFRLGASGRDRPLTQGRQLVSYSSFPFFPNHFLFKAVAGFRHLPLKILRRLYFGICRERILMSAFMSLITNRDFMRNALDVVADVSRPVATSAAKAALTYKGYSPSDASSYAGVFGNVFGDAVSNAPASASQAIRDSVSGGSPRWSDYKRLTDTRDVPVAAAPSAQSLDFLNADLAKYYGMSPETAYQEALSNTAYQRAVKDMQAAGLNPAALFGAGRASIAGGVGYASPLVSESSGSGGFSGSSRRYGSGSSRKYLFSEGAYGAISAAAGLIGIAATKSPTGFWIGSATAKGIMGAMNSIFK